MIDINMLTEKDKGRLVVYKTPYGSQEMGKIKSWNEIYIFVVYKCNNELDRYFNYTANATKPEDLFFK